MQFKDLNQTVKSEDINNRVAQMFGSRINLDSFTTEQLQAAKDKIGLALKALEGHSSFDAINSNDVYQKNRLFLQVIEKRIQELEEKKSKPDFLDMDKDGNKKEPMKKAVADKEKKEVKESAEDEASIIMAAKEIVNKVTGWMESTASMQTEVILELGDQIRNAMGSEKSEQYINTMKPALEALYAQLESSRKTFTDGVAVLTGEQQAPETMGADNTDDIADLEKDVAPEVEPDTADDFTASEPATGGEEPADRKKRESILRRSPRLAEMLSKPFFGKKKV